MLQLVGGDAASPVGKCAFSARCCNTGRTDHKLIDGPSYIHSLPEHGAQQTPKGCRMGQESRMIDDKACRISSKGPVPRATDCSRGSALFTAKHLSFRSSRSGVGGPKSISRRVLRQRAVDCGSGGVMPTPRKPLTMSVLIKAVFSASELLPLE